MDHYLKKPVNAVFIVVYASISNWFSVSDILFDRIKMVYSTAVKNTTVEQIENFLSVLAYGGIFMKEIRLHEGELNVMELLWSNKELAAKDISKIIKEYIGWEKNTTYTVIKRLIDKGAITRQDPGFICRANISKRKIQEIETNALLDKLFNGSISNFLADYLDYQQLTIAELDMLERILSNRGR